MSVYDYITQVFLLCLLYHHNICYLHYVCIYIHTHYNRKVFKVLKCSELGVTKTFYMFIDLG